MSKYYNVDITVGVSDDVDESEIEEKIKEELPDGEDLEEVVLVSKIDEVAR